MHVLGLLHDDEIEPFTLNDFEQSPLPPPAAINIHIQVVHDIPIRQVRPPAALAGAYAMPRFLSRTGFPRAWVAPQSLPPHADGGYRIRNVRQASS